jgi:hypothetical protein
MTAIERPKFKFLEGRFSIPEQMNGTSVIQACGVPVKPNRALMRSKSWSRSVL